METLLKIKREWSKDESVKLLLDIIKSKEIEIGILKSEFSEIEYNYKNQIKELKLKESNIIKNGKPKKLWLKDELINELNKESNALRKNLLEYKRLKNHYSTLYYKEVAKHLTPVN